MPLHLVPKCWSKGGKKKVESSKRDVSAREAEKLSVVQRFTDPEMVDIHVGTDEKLGHFKLHRSILCQNVPYFEKMFNGNFLEGATKSAALSEDDPEDFNILVHWIYSGRLPLLNKQQCDPHNWQVGTLYLLADKLCLPGLMDEVLDSFIFVLNRDNWAPNVFNNRLNMKYLYDCSPRKSCGMVRLIVALLCWLLCTTRFKTDEKHWPTEEIDKFLGDHKELRLEVLKTIRAQPAGTPFKDPRASPGCQFHEHAEGQPCSYNK